jgi:hypothetical protein
MRIIKYDPRVLGHIWCTYGRLFKYYYHIILLYVPAGCHMAPDTEGCQYPCVELVIQ